MITYLSGTWNKRVLVFLFLMMLATYFAGLFVDVTRDGSKYASVAREMYETGDFINLRIHGEPYEQKPPMLFWLSALSFHLFGISNFSFKFPLLLLTFFGFYSAYRLGKSLYNQTVGLIAAVLLGSSQICFLYNMDIHTDTILVPFVTFSLWQLYDFLKYGKNRNWILGFCGIGLAMLSKGPVGALVPAFAVIGYLVFDKQFKRLTDIRWYAGICLALVFILPALAGLYNQFGWEGIRFFFWTNNFGRVSGSYGSTSSDYLFYVYNLLYLFLPWILLLLISVFFEFRSLVRKKLKARDWFVFSGIWFYFIILSVSQGKLPNYLFILIPLFSILTAKYIYISISGKRGPLLKYFYGIQNFVSIAACFVLMAMVFWLFPIKNVWHYLLLLLMGCVALWPVLTKQTPFIKLIIPTLTLIITFNFFLNQHVAPQIFSDQASVKAVKIFNQNAAATETLYNYNYYSHETFFYCKKPVKKLTNDLTLFELMKKPGNWVFTTAEVVNRLPVGEFPVPEIIPLKHVWINNLTFRYLNPASRERSRDTLYLLKSTATPD